ncbi:MAG: sensor histidine kinase [Anaerolineae bacterium]
MQRMTGEPGIERDAVRRMGHDLRNKLGVIQNSVYYLEMKVGRNEARLAKHLDILSREIALCGHLVQDLMDMTAPKEPAPAPTPVQSLVDDVLHRHHPPEGVQVIWEMPAEVPPAQVDAGHVSRAIENVLVYQYATLAPGDEVHIHLRHRGEIYLDFVDSGPGLTRDELGELLTLRPDDEGFTARVTLVVARRLIEVGGGRWQMESRPGIGTRFTFIMPTA